MLISGSRASRLLALRLMLLGCVLALSTTPTYAARKMVLVVSSQVAETEQGRQYKLFYTEVFRRLNMEFEMKTFPSKRCGALANSGLVDGLPSRVAGYEAAHPNLIRINAPLWEVSFTAYALSPSLRVTGWRSLAGQGLRVDCRLGVRNCEEELPKIKQLGPVEFVANANLGLRRLQARRTDLYIDLDFVVDPLLHAEEFSHASIHKAGVLESVPTYLYVHKRNQDLAPALEATLTAMREEGLIAQFNPMATPQSP
ncbi:hypothetical protein ONV78_16650 [Hahella sp. CR1]|uniref:substrate-binding periplasmic protein n=1 Tax=Hahella sp. CR1 TaxID=2992807 RepID=UPI002442EEA2|nr:hypothetical protein [Hahella sp. CR1]MDG9669372.1 hypothetical protein [Hahella sp. CR1]